MSSYYGGNGGNDARGHGNDDQRGSRDGRDGRDGGSSRFGGQFSNQFGGPFGGQFGQNRGGGGAPAPNSTPLSRLGGMDNGGMRANLTGNLSNGGLGGLREASFEEIKRKVQTALINELNPKRIRRHRSRAGAASEKQ